MPPSLRLLRLLWISLEIFWGDGWTSLITSPNAFWCSQPWRCLCQHVVSFSRRLDQFSPFSRPCRFLFLRAWSHRHFLQMFLFSVHPENILVRPTVCFFKDRLLGSWLGLQLWQVSFSLAGEIGRMLVSHFWSAPLHSSTSATNSPEKHEKPAANNWNGTRIKCCLLINFAVFGY